MQGCPVCPQAEVKGRSLVSKPTTQSSRRYAELMPTQAMLAIPKLQRRLDDLKQWPAPSSPEDAWSQSSALATKINATVREVFDADTVEAAERSISVTQFTYNIMHFDRPVPFSKNLEAFENGRKSAIIHLQAILDLVIEKAEDATPSSAHQRVLKAYQGLDLHPAIADAASELYIDGHYSNAIEDAVKALNNLVIPAVLCSDSNVSSCGLAGCDSVCLHDGGGGHDGWDHADGAHGG